MKACVTAEYVCVTSPSTVQNDTDSILHRVLACRMDVAERLDAIDERLRAIEDRLAIHEPPPPEPLLVSAPPRENVLSLTGRAVLILGGAFLLRAATETALNPRIGIALGLAYATVWIAAAAFAASKGRRTPATFHIAAAAAIGYPILSEAVTRFHVLGAVAAAILLAAFSLAMLVVARLYNLQLPAWIAVAGATIDTLILAYATKELIPFALELTFAGVAAFALSLTYVGWLLAIESDLFAVFLVAAALLDETKENRAALVIALLVFAVAWMSMTMRANPQTAIATLIGIGAASALVLQSSMTAVLWAVAAVVAAELARRKGWPAFAVQSALWGIAAAIAGGLFAFVADVIIGDQTTIPPFAMLAAAFCLIAFARLDFARLPLLAIPVCAAAAVAMYATGGAAVVRTIILAATAVALAFVARRWSFAEAWQLSVVTLVLTGVQVIAQELRSGAPAMMFVALAIYGSAMLAIARLRSA
jgi:hypothetical protein